MRFPRIGAPIFLVGVVLGACGGSSLIPEGIACHVLVYASNHDGDWEIYSLAGDKDTQLTDDAANQVNPSWSPDGTQILFTSIDDGFGDLHVMSKDGADVVALTESDEFESSSDWSPDGSTIVFDRVVDDDDDLADHDETDFAQVFTASYGPPLGEATQLTVGGAERQTEVVT